MGALPLQVWKISIGLLPDTSPPIVMKFPIALFLVVVIFTPLIGQNVSPSLSLVLLGIKAIALPLGVWVALALAAGVLTAGTIALLLPRSHSARTSKSRQRRSDSSPPQDPDLGDRQRSQTVDTAPQQAFDQTDDDIEVEYASVRQSPMGNTPPTPPSSDSEVWDDEQWESAEPTNGAMPTPESEDRENRRVVEVRKDPISGDRQGSIYSYSYRSREDLNRSTADFDDEEDEETVDLRDLVPPPERTIDPFPTMEVIDPILEPESLPEQRSGSGFGKKSRSAPKPQPQNQKEDDWGEGNKIENEDW